MYLKYNHILFMVLSESKLEKGDSQLDNGHPKACFAHETQVWLTPVSLLANEFNV